MNKDLLKKYIKDYTFELLKLGETSVSANAGGYLTKSAFRKPKPQDTQSPTGFESEPKPNMATKTLGFKIVKPNDRLNSKDLWKNESLNESRYSQFKTQAKTRTPQEQLHMGVKEMQRKLDEINRLVDFTTRMKNELKGDTEEMNLLKRTHNSLFKINEKIQIINNKIKDLT
jgi:hypothetical protein